MRILSVGQGLEWERRGRCPFCFTLFEYTSTDVFYLRDDRELLYGLICPSCKITVKVSRDIIEGE